MVALFVLGLWALGVLSIVVALAIYAAIEIVLYAAGSPPLLVAPGAALAWWVALPTAEPRAAVIAGAAAAAIAGIVLLWLAIAPGRLPKHALGVTGHTVIADNAVIASAVAERVRRELDVSSTFLHSAIKIGLKPERQSRPGHRLPETIRTIP